MLFKGEFLFDLIPTMIKIMWGLKIPIHIDIEWCKENLSDLAETVYYSENHPDDGDDGVYVDLCKMSLCNGHIIANSSYSWWGAYLGEGTTVAPRKWFGPKGPQKFDDIFLQEWVLND